MKQVRITKIEIKIDDIQISITPEQAKELLNALTELVGEKQIIQNRGWEVAPYVYSIPCTAGDGSIKPPYVITCDTAKISV